MKILRSFVSLIGMFKFNETLFDGMHVPPNMHKETLVNNILLDCGELEVLYSDWDFLKFAITQWSEKRGPVWDKLEETFHYDYVPIENYNRNESENLRESYQHTINHQMNRTEGDTKNSDSTGNTTNSGGDLNTHSIAAYNAPSLVANDSDKMDYGGISDVTGHVTTTDAFNAEQADSDTKQHGVKNDNYRHMWGNIGVTTTQEMIQEERDLDQYSLMEQIIDEFRQRFCILVYSK